ncbi:MAG: DUF1805 domain-containing protein [Candidatus Altiarchaeales archaeon]|nr:DUF1805 domain-containing protein [Candidatus Altiarchaeales archaeon]MBD3416587.1 DUF1805 domain-containing protein [Candidatus Altiarchaeales archaeon]
MIETRIINGCLGLKARLPSANMILVVGERGYLMCGLLNLKKAEEIGQAAAVVTGVSTFSDVLKAEIAACTSKARELGITEGMLGEQAIEILK